MAREDEIKRLLTEAGAIASGITAALPVDEDAASDYRRWIAEGMHGEMDYLARYDDVRSDPRLLLEGALSIIVAAFPYHHSATTLADGTMVARYAVGKDYHDVLRHRLQPVVDYLHQSGALTRVCIDTAPLRERHHAAKAGVGFIGRNNMLIVPGHGSYNFLAGIVTTLPLTPDAPCTLTCGDCGNCAKECPGGALDGTMIDCRRCLSYLTIEYRGDRLPEDIATAGSVYGCDVCQSVCPHNRHITDEPLPEFEPRNELMELTAARLMTIDKTTYRKLTKGSAMSRARIEMIRRNAGRLLRDRNPE